MSVTNNDITTHLLEQVQIAIDKRTPLCPRAGGSKDFLGRKVQAPTLDCSTHRGVINYDPMELVVTARAGTPLHELESVLSNEGQMLPFEPPHFAESATIGGTIACGLSGPRRPYAGSARDFVLGTRIINGHGQVLRFGGEVMKNVAGYDVSRLMTGSMGTLAVLLDVSMKVLPIPETDLTITFEHTPADAIQAMNNWATKPLPISASCHVAGRTHLRLSGSAIGVRSAHATLGGDIVVDGVSFWHSLREHQHAFFHGPAALWRISLPATTATLPLAGQWLLDWGGAQRWLRTDANEQTVRSAVSQCGGHALAWRNVDRNQAIFHPLPDSLLGLHQRIKMAFDPHHVFSPGRMYAQL
ncbi:MAG: glycolate oxidase FAD binding subunit [Gammaproteobacteria bacterium]